MAMCGKEILLDVGDLAPSLAAFVGAKCGIDAKKKADGTLSIPVENGVAAALGTAVAFLCTNRQADQHHSISLHTANEQTTPTPKIQFYANPDVKSMNGNSDPDESVDIYHVHCHFQPESEAAALELLASTSSAVVSAGELVLHDHVWHEKNGPHDPWSWELWVETRVGLGAALEHFVTYGGGQNGLYLAAHCDTDQEFTDHSCRMCWVGPRDELDVHFFAPPDYSIYLGPHARQRQTGPESVFSMGEFWERDGKWGSVKKDKYGKQERNEAPGMDGEDMPSLPALFLPHGSPPIPIEPCTSSQWLSTAASSLPFTPKAILFMSPHFQNPGSAKQSTFAVSADPRPETLYDFDEDTRIEAVAELQKLKYPCSGAPDIARRAAYLLKKAGLPCDVLEKRGLDHGVWTPLYVMFPEGNVPVTCLSVRGDLDSAAHIAAGAALEKLRHEGVLLVGSGEVVHNVPDMGARSSPAEQWCLEFEGWIEKTAGIGIPPSPSPSDVTRGQRLARWATDAPFSAQAHPQGGKTPSPGEHLMPFLFVFGAGGTSSEGRVEHKEYLGSLPMAAYSFS